MVMTSALRRGILLTRNRVSLLAKTCAKQDVCPVISPGQQLHSFRSYASSSLMQTMRIYRSLFRSSKPISRHFCFETAVSLARASIETVRWAKNRIESKVKLLTGKPTHAYQPRTKEIKEISKKIKMLLRQHQNDRVVTLYIRGREGIGKTQLAREYGEKCYKSIMYRRKIVATMDTKSEGRFFRSYHRLALELKCPLYSNLTLEVISTQAQAKMKDHPWLLIVEAMTQERNEYYKQFLPQPGSQQSGHGVVLVTTSDDRIIPRNNRCTDTFEMPLMTEEDAIALLKETSGCHDEEGAKEIVNSKHIDRTPIEVASAGIYINEARSHPDRRDFSFKDYPLPTGPRDQDITATSDDAIVQTAKKLAQSNSTLDKMFRLLTFCPHETLPMNVIKKYLGVHPDLDTVRKCQLLGRNSPEDPADEYDKIERVFLPRITYESFVATFPSESSLSPEQKRNVVSCILEEYEEAHHSHSTSSVWIKQMLFPHIRHFWKICTELPCDERLQLCVALSNSYIDISTDPEKAKTELLQFIADCKHKRNLPLENMEPRDKAKIYLALGTTYRHLGDYEKSMQHLTKALDETKHLREAYVADILREFSATVFSYGEYMNSREHLQTALDLYQETLEDEHPLVVETLSSLAYLCIKEGRWRKAKNYLEEVESQMEKLQSNEHLVTKENLATLYSELGDHDKVIDMLDVEVQEWTKRDEMSPALSLAKLTAAYYRNGDRTKSEKTFEKLESLMEKQKIPLAALQVLGTTVCDFGDIQMAERLCNMMKNVKAGKTEGAQPLLGKVHRLTGNWNEAQRTLEAALQKSEAVYGRNHLRVGKLLGDLGKVYLDQGLLTRSVVTLERAHNIHVTFYGTHSHPHPEVAFVLGDLGRAIQRAGDGEHGAGMMEEALNIWKRSIKNPEVFKSKRTTLHAMYSQMLSNYGILLRDIEKLPEAERFLMDALALQDEILAENSLPRIKTIFRLGTVWERQGKHEEAIRNIESALGLLKPSPDHPYSAVVLTGTARCMKNDTKAALEYLDRALKIRMDSDRRCLDTHALVARNYRVRGERLISQDPLEAHDYIVKAIELLARLIERERTEESHITSDSSINVTIVNKWEGRLRRNRKMLHDLVADKLSV